MKLLISFVICLATLLIGCGKKQSSSTIFSTDTVESYSLPMKSDFSDQYNTALALEFVSCLDKPITFKELFSYDNSNDEYLAAFETLIQAIDKNSIDTIKPLLGKSKTKSIHTPKAILRPYHKGYHFMKSKSKEFFLVKRIKGKDQEAFIWGVKKDDGSFRLGGSLFIKQKNKIIWCWEFNHMRSIFLISRILSSKKISKNRQGSYKYSLVLKDSTDSQMLTLKFNGKIYNNINLEKTTSSKDRFISFYLDFIKALESPKGKYAEFVTEKSGAKLLKQIKKYPFMLNRIRELDKTKTISFIMDASPFYIVFYRRKNITKFDYIVETQKGLKFTNYGYLDDVDNMLRNNRDTIRNVIFPNDSALKHKDKNISGNTQQNEIIK